MQSNREELLADLAGKSPLQITNALIDFELYDATSANKIIEDVYKEFATNDNIVKNVLNPVILSIIDGFLAIGAVGRSARKKGLTASRIFNECENFNYDEDYDVQHDKFAQYENEARNVNNAKGKFVNSNSSRQEYNRNMMHDQGKMNRYKDEKFGDNKTMNDENTGDKIYRHRDNPDARRTNAVEKYQAETDHNVPLKTVFDEYKDNFGLSDKDLRDIANTDSNFSMTSQKINRAKSDKSNIEVINDNDKNGNQLNLNDKAKQTMVQNQKNAEKQMGKDVNKAVFNNMMGKRDSNQQKIIYQNTSATALETSKDAAIGDVILFILKPLYFELKDIIKNGFRKGASFVEAIKIRFIRVKNYVLKNLRNLVGSSFISFIKNFISSFIEGLISLFVGIFKQAWKLLKEGIKLFVETIGVLFGKNAKELTKVEKGDMIIKIIGSSIIAIAGIGLEVLLNKIGIGEPFSIMISVMLSGVASALFMYVVNKADIFGAKIEQRRLRIKEIFDARIADIEETKNSFNVVAIETLRQQREQFTQIEIEINEGIKSDNIDTINSGLYKVADFFQVELPYSNTREFVSYFDSEKIIKI